ncbi:MAG: HAD hydrolase-like protein, partial [Burkholderiales bacterium]|nr:HAD hydrolase-like protein [Burkholderiales bacterium]
SDKIADKHGFRRVERSHIDALRYLDVRQIMARQGISLRKLPFIARDIFALMEADIGRIALFPGIEDVLRTLSDRGVRLAIVSSNAKTNVLRILGPELAARFDYIECGTPLFGKKYRLKRLLAKSKTAPQAALLIGDEVRDAQAAIATGIPFGAVAWGYSHIDSLKSHGPHEVFTHVDDLFRKLVSC